MKKIHLLYLAAILATSAQAQNKQDNPKSYLKMSWRNVATKMSPDWYGSEDAKMVADSVLRYQTSIGGWPKNSGFHSGIINQKEMTRIKLSGVGATFDNGATTTELRFLAKVYSHFKDDRYKKAFLKGLDYIFIAQYENGGWPQFFPVRDGNENYSSHITYNDDAMINTMLFLKEIFSDNKEYASLRLDKNTKSKAQKSFDRGIACILKTQIIAHGERTVWCAQHDEKTLAPTKARSYELPSFSGSESVAIVQLLMNIDKPSSEIIDAINGAVRWFERNKIEGIKIETEIDKDGNKDRVVVANKNSPSLWARFYDLETSKPYFCDRNGIKKNTLAEIGYERRNGYSWYTEAPIKILRQYPEWRKKIKG
jgi:PelA/Pel-15E family pectate lyase